MKLFIFSHVSEKSHLSKTYNALCSLIIVLLILFQAIIFM